MARSKSAWERQHHAMVAELPCLVCQSWPVDVHHVVGYADRMGRAPKRHDRVVPLCRNCHTDGPQAVHKISHKVFCKKYEIDLMAEAERLEIGE
jgi:hypothetical protein